MTDDLATLLAEPDRPAPFDAALGRLRAARLAEPESESASASGAGDGDVESPAGGGDLADVLRARLRRDGTEPAGRVADVSRPAPAEERGDPPGDGVAAFSDDDELTGRLADRRGATTAARYSAAAYAAVQGHLPGGDHHELRAASNGTRRRWALRPRTALVAVCATLLLAVGLALATAWPHGDVQPLVAVGGGSPEPTPHAGTGFVAGTGGAAGGDSGPARPANSAATVVVDVVGQVRTPGLLTLPAGSRVADAVQAAGGASDGADLGAVNLARPLVDGEQVRIPAPGEAVAPPPGTSPAAAAGGAAGTSAAASADGLINLNTADAATLESLPGVGPALAGRILDWRQQNGSFASVDELDEVSGIGPAMMAKLRDLVTV